MARGWYGIPFCIKHRTDEEFNDPIKLYTMQQQNIKRGHRSRGDLSDGGILNILKTKSLRAIVA